MPFCPKCKYEYRAEQTVCPDCNVPLVDRLPTKTAAAVPDDSWVSVGRVNSEMTAEMARGALESSNIPSVIVSSAFGTWSGSGSTGILEAAGKGSNMVMVPREYRDDAEIILKAVLGDDLNDSRSVR